MLRSVYLKTLRDMRWGILGWGVGLGLLMLVTAVGWAKAYPDAASRATLQSQIEGGLSVTQVIYGRPERLDQLGGFLEWRVLGLAPVLLGAYLIVAGTGATRGAEDAQRAEVVAAAVRSRRQMLVEQAAAVATGGCLVALLSGVIGLAAGPVSGEASPGVAGMAGALANVAGAGVMAGALGWLAAQCLAPRRTAAFVAASVLAVTHLMNTIGLVVPGLSGLRYASPLYLYSRSAPLAGGGFDWPAFAGLLAIGAALAGLALLANGRRDMFEVFRLHKRRTETGPEAAAPRRPAPGPWLRSSFANGLRTSRGAVVGWAVALALLAVLMTALTPSVREALLQQTTSEVANRLARAGLTSERGVLSVLLFSFLPVLATVFAVMLAAGWGGEEQDQRLELELATPIPRWRVFLSRIGAAAVAIAIVAAVAGAALLAAVEAEGLDVPAGAVAGAVAGLCVLGVAVVALGFAMAAWRPGMVSPLAGAFVAVSYFANLLVPLLDLPRWAQDVSVFGLYGQPLTDGVSAWRLGVLAAAALVLGIVGMARFERKDIAR